MLAAAVQMRCSTYPPVPPFTSTPSFSRLTAVVCGEGRAKKMREKLLCAGILGATGVEVIVIELAGANLVLSVSLVSLLFCDAGIRIIVFLSIGGGSSSGNTGGAPEYI